MSSRKAKAGPCWRYPSTHQNNLLPHVRWRPNEAGQEPEIAQHLTASPPSSQSGRFGVEGLSVPVHCCQDLRPELREITVTWPRCVWIMVCLGDALKAHHHGEPWKCTSRWAMSGACWHWGSLIFYSALFFFFVRSYAVMKQSCALADRKRLVIIMSAFLRSSSVIFFDIVKSAVINNASLSPLSCRVLIRRFFAYKTLTPGNPISAAAEADTVRLIKGGYLFDCNSISLPRG